jgi:predicted RND superfamily exporter protein
MNENKSDFTNFTLRSIDLIARRPVVSIILGFLLAVGSIAGAPRIHADFTHRGFFYDDDPLLKQFDAFERRFGNDDSVIVAMHSPSGIFDLESAALLRELTEKMWQVPEVIRVDSLSNYNWVHAHEDEILVEPLLPDELTPAVLEERKKVALSHEVIPGYLVSKDANTALLFARIKPGIDKPPDAPAITSAVLKLTKELTRGDHQFYVTGGPAITQAFKEVAESDMSRLVPMALGIAALFLFLALRSIVGVVLPLVVMVLTVGATFGFSGWLGITVTNISTIVPTMMIAVTIADSVHILVTYFESLKRGMARRDAARYTLEKNYLPTFMTSFTTALGFASFVTANLKPLSGLGMMAAFGTMLAWVLTYLFLGGLLFVLPIKAGRIPPEAAVADERRATSWVKLIVRRRGLIMASSAVISIAAVLLSLRIDINADPFKYFSKHVPVRVSNEFIESSVGGARGVEIVVEAGREDGIKDPAFLAKVDQLQTWVQTQPDVTRAVSIVDILKAMNRSLNGDRPEEYRLATETELLAQELFLYTMSLPQGMDLNDRVTLKNDALRMTIMWKIANSSEVMATVRRIEAKGRELGLSAHATGKFYLYNGTNGYVVRSFVTSLLMALASITLVMVLFLRDFKLGLIAMIPNTVPILVGGAILYLMGRSLDIGTALVASVCLGVAVDDTIHVLANFKRYRRQGKSPNDALREMCAHTASPLIVTTGILVAAFGSFLTADFIPNLFFGVFTAIILGVALIADLTLTPALLARRSDEP